MDVQMPILDGYRATHLIRHHNPYSSLPGMHAIPIVAMTASAIQGDREKCQRAGMDDYLAKPVKAKTLEKMLVKWALEIKRNTNRAHFGKARSSTHGSACPENDDRSPCSGSPETPIEALQAKESAGRAREFADRSRLPGIESESDRGMRRAEAEEKAISLRDEKLFITASESRYAHHRTSPQSTFQGAPPRPLLPAAALTEENIEKFERLRDGESARSQLTPTPVALRAHSDPNMAVGLRDSSFSSLVESPGSPNGGRTRIRAKGEKGVLNRNESDMSQRTVTLRSSVESSTDSSMMTPNSANDGVFQDTRILYGEHGAWG